MISDENLYKMIDCIYSTIKWYCIQLVLFFFMPYLGKGLFNISTLFLIFCYTAIYIAYWTYIPKHKRLTFILLPYLVYSFLVLLLKILTNPGLMGQPALSVSWSTLFLPLGGALCYIVIKLYRRYTKQIRRKYKFAWILSYLMIGLVLFVFKSSSVSWQCARHGTIEGEKEDILDRKAYLEHKIVTSPEQLIHEMPAFLGAQFQGEWALYSCSMLSAALVNISRHFPETTTDNMKYVDRLIAMVISPEMKYYDRMRWNEDPLESLNGSNSHVSYLSHLAWMITGYKYLGGDEKYDQLLSSLCAAMNRRILESKCLNLSTYPNEAIYMPDMLVAIVALNEFANLNKGMYRSTVKRWLAEAKKNWCDEETGILVSFLKEDGTQYADAPIKGAYSALNCYYLTLIDEKFAKEQYERVKSIFWKDGLVMGLKEYHNQRCLFGLDVDAGVVISDLSPSGTAFLTGPATFFTDQKIRNEILRTGEIAGHTIYWNGSRHYLLANVALVGEAIMLAMRTNYNLK